MICMFCLIDYIGREEYANMLARFPMIIDTQALQRRKAKLESQIDENERAIEKFSMQRVYVAQ